mgnify:CR=1 FL=1
MNMMVEALKKSRQDAPASTATPAIPAKPEEPKVPGMDMEKCMTDMSAKLDHILTLLSGNKSADEKETEDNGNGNGY